MIRNLRKMRFSALYQDCRLCPRACGVNRLDGEVPARRGVCREGARLRVAHIGPHFGEEPPISGTRGSGTVFLCGCSLGCRYCQNYQISQEGLGEALDVEDATGRIVVMITAQAVHNVNFVTPDHFLPHVAAIVTALREQGHTLPMVMNCSGYQAPSALALAEPFMDIYLPDFKYADPGLAHALSRARDYPAVALEAIAGMVRQKGFLQVDEARGGLARRGVLVRHLILPGQIPNSLQALTSLLVEFGPGLPLSLMSQYHPVRPQKEPDLNRFLTPEEFRRVYAHAQDLGFEHLYVQFPEGGEPAPGACSPFLPDFRNPRPFGPQR